MRFALGGRAGNYLGSEIRVSWSFAGERGKSQGLPVSRLGKGLSGMKAPGRAGGRDEEGLCSGYEAGGGPRRAGIQEAVCAGGPHISTHVGVS